MQTMKFAFSKVLSTAVLAVAFTSALSVSAPVQAQSQPNGYVQSSGGTVRSGFGLCWRTGYWTPQMATLECDPDLVPKPAAAPAPVAAAPAAATVAPPPPPKPVIEKVTLKGDTLFDFD